MVNSQIITKTIKVATVNADVIWTSELIKVKKKKSTNVCVSVELPVVTAFQLPSLTEGHCPRVTMFHNFHKHPLA